jgi:hypothetical protein
VISYQASSQAGARGWLGLFVDKSAQHTPPQHSTHLFLDASSALTKCPARIIGRDSLATNAPIPLTSTTQLTPFVQSTIDLISIHDDVFDSADTCASVQTFRESLHAISEPG